MGNIFKEISQGLTEAIIVERYGDLILGEVRKGIEFLPNNFEAKHYIGISTHDVIQSDSYHDVENCALVFVQLGIDPKSYALIKYFDDCL